MREQVSERGGREGRRVVGVGERDGGVEQREWSLGSMQNSSPATCICI